MTNDTKHLKEAADFLQSLGDEAQRSPNAHKVISLVTATVPQPLIDTEVVAFLEDLVCRAKVGEFNGVAVVSVQKMPGNDPVVAAGWAGTFCSDSYNILSIGAIEVLKGRYMQEGEYF